MINEILLMESQNRREGSIKRTTGETDIEVKLVLDGKGETTINTDVPFLDHMLTLFGVHGFFNLQVTARGDVEVDDHHTVEDLGICLGKAFAEALDDKVGINRYGYTFLPMDEALVRVALDLSNRPYLVYNVSLPDQKVGSFDTALVKEFMRAFCQNCGVTLHIDLLHGENSHHIIEAVFKGLGRAMNQAVSLNPSLDGALSSKGCL